MSEPVPATPRKSMHASRRKRILDSQGGVCGVSGCGCSGLLEIDHIIPLELTGKDEDGNLQLLCVTHHKIKTKQDKADIARARRRRKKAAGETKPKRQIPNRGWDKSRRRKMDGSVVPR